jgi:hypothetical protein
MKRDVILFAVLFMVGALLALALRTARHDAYAGHTGHPEAPAYQPMVDNTAPAQPVMETPPATNAPHADHGAGTSTGTVNSICAICGMEVDPSIAAAVYRGQAIGFGCRLCPPKFAADPERYGPAALANREAE